MNEENDIFNLIIFLIFKSNHVEAASKNKRCIPDSYWEIIVQLSNQAAMEMLENSLEKIPTNSRK